MRISPPRDLLFPGPGSTTTRAVLSFARRLLFDRFAALTEPSGLTTSTWVDYQATREVLVSFLPGRPHLLSDLLEVPTIGAAIRSLLSVRGDEHARDLCARSLNGHILFELAQRGELTGSHTLHALPALSLPAHAKQVRESKVARFSDKGAVFDNAAPERDPRFTNVDGIACDRELAEPLRGLLQRDREEGDGTFARDLTRVASELHRVRPGPLALGALVVSSPRGLEHALRGELAAHKVFALAQVEPLVLAGSASLVLEVARCFGRRASEAEREHALAAVSRISLTRVGEAVVKEARDQYR